MFLQFQSRPTYGRQKPLEATRSQRKALQSIESHGEPLDATWKIARKHWEERASHLELPVGTRKPTGSIGSLWKATMNCWRALVSHQEPPEATRKSLAFQWCLVAFQWVLVSPCGFLVDRDGVLWFPVGSQWLLGFVVFWRPYVGPAAL